MSVPIKLYLHRDWSEEPIEIRRILLDLDSYTGYAYLIEKIGQLFPSLCTDNLTLVWLDDDEDRVTISSDAELNDALEMYNGSMFRLLIKEQRGTTAEQRGTTTEQRGTTAEQRGTRGTTDEHNLSIGPLKCQNYGQFKEQIGSLGFNVLTCDTPSLQEPSSPEHAMGAKRPNMAQDRSSPECTKRPRVAQDRSSPECSKSKSSTHPLTSSTHPLASSTHSLASSTHSLTSSTHPFTSSTHPLTSSTHPLTGSAHPLTSSTHSLLTGSTHPLTGSTHPLTGSTHPLTSSTHSLIPQPREPNIVERAISRLADLTGIQLFPSCDDEPHQVQDHRPLSAKEQESLSLLKDMGFNVEDWQIVKLIRANNGDIQAFIETLYP